MNASNEQNDELRQYFQNHLDIENFRVHLRVFAAGSDYQRDFLVKRISLLFELYDAARAENDRLRAAKHEAIASAEAAINSQKEGAAWD